MVTRYFHDLERRPLPATGEVLTHTEVNVAALDFAGDVAISRPVALAVGRSETTGDRVLVLEPA